MAALTEATIEARLAPDVLAPREARGLVKALRPHVDRPVFDSVLLLVSELVTNSVRHGHAGPEDHVDLAVQLHPATVRVVIRDAGDSFVERAPPTDPLQEGGWGLHLVDVLADRWGIRHGGSTEVWAELDRSTA